jgi:hypothetical protein
MKPIAYVDRPGLQKALSDAGCRVAEIDGIWYADKAVAAQNIVDTFDPLPGLIEKRIEECRQDVLRRTEAIVPLWRQIDIVREMAVLAFVPAQNRTSEDDIRFQALQAELMSISAVYAAAVAIEASIRAETDWHVLAAMRVSTLPAWPA